MFRAQNLIYHFSESQLPDIDTSIAHPLFTFIFYLDFHLIIEINTFVIIFESLGLFDLNLKNKTFILKILKINKQAIN